MVHENKKKSGNNDKKNTLKMGSGLFSDGTFTLCAKYA